MLSQKLKIFVAVAENGSITNTAEKLYISQPAISRYIKSLEDELGTNGIARRGITLPKGEHMRKIMFVGRSEAGKTTLKQALKGESITYMKTQSVNYFDVIIDTPGEYTETKSLATALGLYSYEADVVGLLISAIEPFSLYPPASTAATTRECVGIVTKIDHPLANVERAAEWLRLAGCRKIFYVNSRTGEGVSGILDYLKEDGPRKKRKWNEDEATVACLSSGEG